MKSLFQLKLLPALLAVGFAGGASASGFQLQNQNGSGTGLAYAGAAAVAEDASTIFFNPAGMTYLPEGKNIVLGGTVLDRSVKFMDTGTTRLGISGTPVGPALGDDGGNGGGTSLIPAFFYTQSLTPDLLFGFGATVTYGSETEYNEQTFAGRFSSFYSSITQFNLNPSLAYRLSDRVSIGAGLNFAQNDTEIKLRIPVSGTPVTETTSTIKGDDSAWGYNVGLTFQPTDETRIGLSYRSSIKFDVAGTATLLLGSPVSNVTVPLETPDSFSFALSHKLSNQTELLADATWTGWSSIQSLPLSSSLAIQYQFEDTWRVGLGIKHQWNDKWNLRAGVAFDQTPVPNPAMRTMTIPDSDRTWLSFGARYALSKQTSIDFGYAHIFFDDAPTERAVAFPGPLTQTIKGNFDTSANLLSIQLNHNF